MSSHSLAKSLVWTSLVSEQRRRRQMHNLHVIFEWWSTVNTNDALSRHCRMSLSLLSASSTTYDCAFVVRRCREDISPGVRFTSPDYCNALLRGICDGMIRRLRTVQNADATRQWTSSARSHHAVLRQLLCREAVTGLCYITLFLKLQNTRKPSCRKETARYRSCSVLWDSESASPVLVCTSLYTASPCRINRTTSKSSQV